MRAIGVVAVGLLLVGLGAPGMVYEGTASEGEAGGDQDNYSLSNFLRWNHHELDILIVPPAHGPVWNPGAGPFPYGPDGALPMGTYLAATLHALEDWRYALDQVADSDPEISWVKDIVWDVRIVAADLVTPQDIDDADIVKVYTETTYPILGAAVNSGSLSFGLGPGCVAYSTKWMPYGSMTYEDMYYLAGHELLHCFGMSHPDNMEPREDIMSYESWPIPELRCPSNLNVLAAAAAFAGAFNAPTGPNPGATVHVGHSEYQQYCSPDSGSA